MIESGRIDDFMALQVTVPVYDGRSPREVFIIV